MSRADLLATGLEAFELGVEYIIGGAGGGAGAGDCNKDGFKYSRADALGRFAPTSPLPLLGLASPIPALPRRLRSFPQNV